MSETYNITETDKRRVIHDYVLYLAGVAMLHDPFATAKMQKHHYDPGAEPDSIVEISRRMMLTGLRSVIESSHKPGYRKPLSRLEEKFEVAEPNMQEIRDYAYTDEGAFERVKRLLPAENTVLSDIQPAAMLERQTYKYICHSRGGTKIKTDDLMHGVLPHSEIALYLSRPKIEVEI